MALDVFSPALAWNQKLCACRIDDNRQERRIIRIREDSVKGEGATPTLDLNEDSMLGKEFSESELNLVSSTSAEVVVLVGEVVSEAAVQKISAPNHGEAKNRQSFDPTQNTVLPRQEDSFVVVRKISDGPSNLYRLAEKDQEGLCCIKLMPKPNSQNGLKTRLFFYPEWVTDREIANHKERAQDWKNGISDFCKTWSSAHPSRDVKQSPAKPKTFVPTDDETRVSIILKNLGLFQVTGRKVFIDQAMKMAKDTSGYIPSSDHSEEQIRLLSLLFTGIDSVDMGEAAEIATGLQASMPSSTFGTRSSITRQHIFHLARGIRAKLQGEDVVVPCHLRLGLVVAFGFKFDNRDNFTDTELAEAIKGSWAMAESFPANRGQPRPATDGAGKIDTLHSIIMSQAMLLRRGIKMMRDMQRKQFEICPPGGTDLATIPEIFEALAIVDDQEKFEALIHDLAQVLLISAYGDFTAAIHLWESVLETIQETLDQIEGGDE